MAVDSNEMAEKYYHYLVLAEFLISFLCDGCAVLNYLKILNFFFVSAKNQKNSKIAVFLSVLLVNYFLTSLFLLPYDAYILSVWRPSESYRNGNVLFWVSVPGHCMLATLPLSVLFLTLDRIMTIKFFGKYRHTLLSYSLFPLITLFVFGSLYLFSTALPVPENTPCWTHGCIVGPRLSFYLMWRVLCSFSNFVSGTAFFYLLYKRQSAVAVIIPKGRHSANKINNMMTVLAVSIEFFFNFVPHLVLVVHQWVGSYKNITGDNPSLTWGGYSSLLFSIESCAFSFVYKQVHMKKRSVSAGTSNT